ncbi:MAG: acyltransferase [Pseudomonadota bacterium]
MTLPTGLFSKLAILACSVVVGLVVWFAVTGDALSRIDRVELSVGDGQSLTVSLSHQKRFPGKWVDHGWHSENVGSGATIHPIIFDMGDYPAALFAVRIEGDQSNWPIHSIRLVGTFGEDKTLQGHNLVEAFVPSSDSTRLNVIDGIATVSTSGSIAQIHSTKLFRFSNPLVNYVLPVLAALGAYIFFSRLPLAALPAIRLSNKTQALQAGHSLELDGLRGIAAASVVADHTWGFFSGSGLVGVWIFFALSGYLLSIPFAKEPSRVFNGRKLGQFYLRRISRIVPMYYCLLFVLYVASGQVYLAIPHFLFLQGNNHLWTIVQEMVFYLALPFVLAIMALLHRFSAMLSLVFLAAVTGVLLLNPDIVPLNLKHDNFLSPPYFGWFLVGVIASYTLHGQASKRFVFLYRPRIAALVGWFALLVMALMFLFGSVEISQQWFGSEKSLAKQWNFLFAVGAAYLVLAAVVSKNTIFGWVLRWLPFRSFGVVGYSAYLIHPLLLAVVIEVFRNYHQNLPSGLVLFLIVLTVTWIISVITFSFIEYPFLRRKPATRADS